MEPVIVPFLLLIQTLIDSRAPYWAGAAISFWVLWRFVWDYGPLICL